MTLSLGGSIGASTNVFYYSDSLVHSEFDQNPVKLSYSIGAILHSPTFYVGYSFRRYPGFNVEEIGAIPWAPYLISPRSRFVSTAQLAYVFRKKKSDKVTFSPALLLQFYERENGFVETRYQINFSLKRNFFFWGAGFSSSSIFMTIGFHGEKIRLAYSASGISESTDTYNSYRFVQEMVLSYTFIHKD